MKKLTIFIILSSLVVSCSKKSEIKGCWIEVNNFNSPIIIRFDDDFIYNINAKDYPESYKLMYKIKSDTLFIQSFGGIEALKYEIKNNFLSFYSFENDTLLISYEKTETENYINYFNEKKNTNIELVNLNYNESIDNYGDIISLYLYKTNGYELLINGNKALIDSLLYINLWSNKSPDYSFLNANLYIDKSVEMSAVNKVRKELSKALRYKVSYITTNDRGELLKNNVNLPPVIFNYPDSLKNIPPPSPPLPEYSEYKSFFKENLLVEIENSYVKINDTISEYNHIIEKIDYQLMNKQKPIIFLYLNEQTTFEKYITITTEIKKLYRNYRNKFSQENYNESDYEDLNYEEQVEIRNIYPLRIKEIETKELNEIKKYAL